MGLLNSQDDKELLLYRKWLTVNKSREDKTQVVASISLSSSGEWIMVKTLESLALLKADSAVGQDLWAELKKFSGKAKALIIYPEKGKLGFDLDFHESKTAFYEWVDDELIIGKKRETRKTGISGISWKKAQLTEKPSLGTPDQDESISGGQEQLEHSSGTQKTTKSEKGKPLNKQVNESLTNT